MDIFPFQDNLFLWNVELSDFPKGTPFYKDLESYAKRTNRKPVIEIEMKFPKDYPMNPPFVRVIRPRFQFLTGKESTSSNLTVGGIQIVICAICTCICTGHVTIGGSICMQMLTRSGWTPSNDIEVQYV